MVAHLIWILANILIQQDNCNVTCVNKTALMDIKDNCLVKVFHMSLKRLLGFAKVLKIIHAWQQANA
ncbi:hypothetical protein T4B_679 [Trichinella pseudospiralis]|uniref:Uncharacterized protein n=1 Tax=Trichinella pseudospiralis TaxID=6337 RepID=A0A0V1J937_TRIPS|nr:hypothetical protein T4A_12063 [Trichinella pseudospiralis]KRZ31495.1 hypothetical protein T4B_679 [Trichinella pseudospiralis]KRZ43073.1 hypothetical protein T4C_8490 [Trichinella pseudospiralis]